MNKMLAPLMIAALFAMPAMAAEVVAPGGPGNAQGPAPFRYYGSGGSNVQQIYSSSFFGAPSTISALSFRAYPGAAPSGFFSNSFTISEVMVRLTTTSLSANEASGLQPSTNFAANLGSGFTTVFSGPLTLTTAANGVNQPFDYTINFSTLFNYDPTMGNLLLDVFIPTSATVSGGGLGFLTFDNANTLNDGVRSVVNIFDGGSPTGLLDTSAAITSFTTSPIASGVPEPSTWAFMILGFGATGAAMRRRRVRMLTA